MNSWIAVGNAFPLRNAAVAAGLIFFLMAGPLVAQAPVESADQVDRYVLEEMRNRQIPGLALAVVKDGVVVKSRGYGLADVERNVPVTPETRFNIASVDKQFTATLVMMLVEEGKLALEDEISKHLSGDPRAWKGIRIRHLLSHTSGLSDDWVETVRGREFFNYTTKELYDHARTVPLIFRPGTGWSYSDQGFFLLCLLVERVAGKPYHDVLRERILGPLGMTGVTVWEPKQVISNRASGYILDGGKLYRNRREIEYGLWNDLLLTTADLVKWDAALYTEKLLRKSSLEQMWTPARLNNGQPVRFRGAFRSYGFGWVLDTFRGHRIISHGGYTGVNIWRMPDDRTAVIVLTNLDRPSDSNPHGLANGVAGFYVPGASWLAMQPKSDAAPESTGKLREELLRLQAGKSDAALYAPEFETRFRKALTQDIHADLKLLGDFKSLAYLDQEVRDGGRLLYYRAEFARGRYFLRIFLDAAGRIAGMQGDRI
jgi:CubicO group peptidase (beta-lactamase class C family)